MCFRINKSSYINLEKKFLIDKLLINYIKYVTFDLEKIKKQNVNAKRKEKIMIQFNQEG